MRKQITQILSAVIVVLTIFFLNGCSDSSKPSSGDGKIETKDRVYTIGMSQCNLGEPWRVQMNEDVKNAAAKHSNLRVVFKDAQNDTLKQRSHVEEFVSSKVDLIII